MLLALQRRMDSALTFNALSYGLVGLLWVAGLVLSLVSIRKESRCGIPLKGLMGLTVAVMGLCTFIALLSLRKPKHSKKIIGPAARVISEKDLPR